MSQKNSQKEKVTLLIPVLNEIEGMKQIMPQIQEKCVDEILIIDGGSTDGTYEYALQHHHWKVIRQQKKGLINAYRESFPAAQGDIIVLFSPDGNSLPELIPPLIAKMREGYDMVIVSRYLGVAKSADDDFLTGFGNWMFTKLINVCFGGNYTDSLVIFRAVRKEIINHLEIDPKRAGLEPQLSIYCAKKKLKVAEIPGDEPARIGGTRKMHPFWNGLGIFVLIVREFFHR